MNAVVERSENSEATLKVEVEPERLAQATDKAYRRLVQRVNIPGFRRGKAPRRILERTVGIDALYREALDFVMPSAYEEAVKESNIEPYARPEFEVVQLEPEKALIFKAVVPLQPSVKLGDYHSISVEPEGFAVTDEELNQALENLRNTNGQWVPVEDRPVQMGDQVALDVLTELEGRSLGEKPREVLAELDSEQPVPGWAHALVGLEAGAERDVTDTISADYRDANLAGKTVVYKVKAKSIKRRELPEIDDELARAVGEYEDLEALRNDLRQRLEVQKQAKAKEKFENDVVDKLVELSEIEFPSVMVERELDQMLREADSSFRRQGLSLDMFLRASHKSAEDLRQDWRPRAAKRLRSSLVLREVVAKEQIQVEPARLETALQRMVDDTPADQRGEARQLLTTPRVRESVVQELQLRDALDLLDRLAGGGRFVELDGGH